ncbi:hypothetical protein N7501_000231 [Penicillium viridicatum]|nr:hypothetical protein N7501_000231 [Penicillium viridicatum]
MAESQAQPHAFLRSLSQQVKDFEPDFPSRGDLEGLGIQTFEVPFDPNESGALKFDPVQKQYEVHLNIRHIRTIQDFIEKGLGVTKYPPGVAPILENLSCLDRPTYLIENEAPDYKADDPPTMEGHEKPKTWRVISHYRYADRPLKPHSVMSCISGVRPTDTNRGLSTHELRAIVCTMLLRVNHKPFRTCRTHPILVLSFLGDQQGRVIQASYDGKGMILQYSQIWSFADAEKAPVELFLRYRLSEPVGGTYTLSIR